MTPRERMIKSEANLGYAVRILIQNKTNEKGKTGTLATLQSLQIRTNGDPLLNNVSRVHLRDVIAVWVWNLLLLLHRQCGGLCRLRLLLLLLLPREVPCHLVSLARFPSILQGSQGKRCSHSLAAPVLWCLCLAALPSEQLGTCLEFSQWVAGSLQGYFGALLHLLLSKSGCTTLLESHHTFTLYQLKQLSNFIADLTKYTRVLPPVLWTGSHSSGDKRHLSNTCELTECYFLKGPPCTLSR